MMNFKTKLIIACATATIMGVGTAYFIDRSFSDPIMCETNTTSELALYPPKVNLSIKSRLYISNRNGDGTGYFTLKGQAISNGEEFNIDRIINGTTSTVDRKTFLISATQIIKNADDNLPPELEKRILSRSSYKLGDYNSYEIRKADSNGYFLYGSDTRTYYCKKTKNH
ncbi:hypothetical protein [Pragia fontium]|nr:hypothetical protein [Pragia fontium]